MRRKNSGNISLALTLIILVSFIGLSLLSYSLAHSRISRARNGKVIKTNGLYQAVILYFHQFKEKLAREDFKNLEEPEVNFFNPENFPAKDIEGYTITSSFNHKTRQNKYYKETRVTTGLLANDNSSNYAMGAEAIIDILDGCIPLTLVPVFINTEPDQEKDAFLEEKKIETDEDEAVVEEVETEIDTRDYLAETFKIKGSAVTWAHIRERFGFEVSDQPIEEGVYLLEEQGIVETLFVQGDVEKLVFSTGLYNQEILLICRGKEYEICYRPGQDYFYSPFPHIPDNALFKENLVINGNAWSIEQDGEAAFHPGANIKLLVAGKAVITTSLESGKVALGRMPSTNLTLVSKATGALAGDGQEQGIKLNAGEEASISATLISDGKLENLGGHVHLNGSLYATDIENDGLLEVDYCPPSFDSTPFFKTGQFRYIDNFIITAIEEVYNEK